MEETINKAENRENIDNYELWRSSIEKILAGIILSFFTINLLFLNYLMPLLSMGMIFLGTYNLRNHNEKFRTTFKYALMYIIVKAINLIISGTELSFGYFTIPILVINIVATVAFLYQLREAIKDVFYDLNIKMEKDPLLHIMIASSLLSVSFLFPLISFPIFFWLLAELFQLHKFRRVLEDLPVMVEEYDNNVPIVTILGGSAILILALSLIAALASSYDFEKPMLKERAISSNSEMESKLLEEGASPWVINMLSESELNLFQSYKNAQITKMREHKGGYLNYQEYTEREDGTRQYIDGHLVHESPLVTEGIFIEMDNTEVYYLVAFKWQHRDVNWKSGLTMQFNKGENVYFNDEFIKSANIVYQKEGKEYIKPLDYILLHDFQESTYNMSFEVDDFLGPYYYDYATEFSFPRKSSDNKLYLIMKFDAESAPSLKQVNTIVYETENPIVSPYIPMIDRLKSPGYFKNTYNLYDTYLVEDVTVE